MSRRAVAVLVLAVLATTGCNKLLKKKKKAAEQDPPAMSAPVAAASSAPTKPDAPPPPPFVAPAALPADEVYLLGDKNGAVIRIDARGRMKRDDKISLLDVTRGKDGAVYGTTTADLRKAAGGAWKSVRKYGDKTSLALIMGDSATLRVLGGVRGLRVSVLTDRGEAWTGPIDDNVMVGGPLNLVFHPVLDGSGRVWGTSVDDALLMEKGSDFEKVAWAPPKTLLVVPRAGEGVFAIASDRAFIGAQGKDAVSAALPVAVSPTTKFAASANDTLVLKASPDTLVFVSAAGGVSAVKATVSDTFAVDGRSRVWTLDGDTLRVIGPGGAAVASKKLPAKLKPEGVRRIVALGGGADLK